MTTLQKNLLFGLFMIAGTVLAVNYFLVGKKLQALFFLLQYLLLGLIVYPAHDSFKHYLKRDWLIKVALFVIYTAVVYLNYRVATNS